MGVFALWIGYRVMGYWNDQRLLAELSMLEPTCGYQGASWGAPDLRHVPQNSVLFRPGVWRIIYPVFTRVDTIVLKNVTDIDLQRCQGIVERFSCPIEVSVIMSDTLSDSGVEALARFNNLNGVSLFGTHHITDRGVARLCAQQPHLEVLSLGSRALTDQCVLDISRLRRLQHLTLFEFTLSLSSLQLLGAMESLETLDLRSAGFTDEAYEQLPAFRETHPEKFIMY